MADDVIIIDDVAIPEGTVLADSIAYLPHLAAWNTLFLTWFAKKDYSQFLIYIIDSVKSEVLPLLAWQLDVLGFRGWNLATNDDERRALIKKAIELHRYKGTVWAVKESLASIGYGDLQLVEHVDGHWANFRFTVDLGSHGLDEDEIDSIVEMVKLYKNTRSHLVDIQYGVLFQDGVIVKDSSLIAPGELDSDLVRVGKFRLCDGTYLCDGTIDCSADEDVVIWTLL